MAKYEEWLTAEGLLKLEAYARDGLTDEDIAEKIGINRTTLYDWKKKYSDISDALKRGKEVVDVQVENALLKRALGYSYNEDKYIGADMDEVEYEEKLHAYMNAYKFEHPEASESDLRRARELFPKNRMILVERKVKEVAPDTTAQIFWLKNRKPEAWRDKVQQEVTHSGEIKTNNPLAGLTTEELRKLIDGG